MKTSLKAALCLGVAPLVLGVVIFVAWLKTNSAYLAEAGMLTLLGGTVAVLLGTGCLVSYLWRYWRDRTIPRRRLVLQAVGVMGLYAANLIAAAVIVDVVFTMMTRYTVTIVN